MNRIFDKNPFVHAYKALPLHHRICNVTANTTCVIRVSYIKGKAY